MAFPAEGPALDPTEPTRAKDTSDRTSTRSIFAYYLKHHRRGNPGRTEPYTHTHRPDRDTPRHTSQPRHHRTYRERPPQRFRPSMPVAIEEEPSEGRSSSSSTSDDDSPRPPAPTNYFAPPFYGRPGTPLPPSPSITSLLIPSRPTTPDLSDAEDEAPPSTDRKAPQVPTYEYYGFVLYLFSSLTFGVYLLWSYLPSPFLHALGIEYYPNRWWSLAVPAWVVIALVYIFVALGSYNVGYLTPSVGSVETVVDDAGFVAVLDGKGRKRGGRKKVDYREVWGQGTDGVMDVPLGGVCEILHGGEEIEEEEDAEDGRSRFWRLLEL